MPVKEQPLTPLDRQAGSFMVRKVKTVEGSTPLIKSIKIMRNANIGCVVVTEKGKPAGIFTERDLVRRLADGLKSLNTSTSSVMSKPLVSTSVDATLSDVVKIMRDKKIRRLPVIGKGKLVGIVTEGDVARLIFSQHRVLIESTAGSILFGSY